jgi:exodeoxyribonuclease V alpha subunit
MENFARALTALLTRQAGAAEREIAVAVNALATGLAEGHVCVETAEDEAVHAALPVLKKLRTVVGSPGDFTPLVLDGTRLYLGRYWHYEWSVASAMRRLASPVSPSPSVKDLRRHLRTLFPGDAMRSEQAFAALGAAVRNLAVVSGGPGTGKTTTVSKVLALRLLLRDKDAPYTIRLAAPTGKAADRMREAIVGAKRTLAIDPDVLRRIPEEASTIHRLLGIRDGSGQPLHHAGDPIAADLVVLDEASMIDLSLMARLVDALRPGAGLILLGDRDQLDAVQPGSVFGELGGEATYSKDLLTLASEVFGQSADVPVRASGLTDALFLLTKSYRFREDAGIGSLARAVNAGDDAGAIAILRGDTTGELVWNNDPASAPGMFPADVVARWLKPYFACVKRGGPEAECLQLFSAFRLLTPVREGRGSVQALNEQVEQWLRREGAVTGDREWYPGKPVMVTANNYTLGLYNGDVGITLTDERGNLRVVFPGSGGSFRSYAPARLPAHDSAYATTVHKSQGSEFDEVLLLIPDAESPVVTRNLLYTAVTRARQRCTIWASEDAVRAGTSRKPVKLSGLAARLHDPGDTIQ